MAAPRITSADRVVIRSALRDAIEWQESILATHDPGTRSVESCCTPGHRCEQYRIELATLERYERLLAKLAPASTD